LNLALLIWATREITFPDFERYRDETELRCRRLLCPTNSTHCSLLTASTLLIGFVPYRNR
jgi:hypothetical protein